MNTPDAQPPVLPALSDDRVAGMERAVFARIAADRDHERRRRRLRWSVGGAAAAIVLVAAVIAPGVMSSLSGGTGGSSAVAPIDDRGGVEWGAVPEGAQDVAVDDSRGAVVAPEGLAATGREVISNASATVVVEDVAEAAAAVARDAEARGGYVESQNLGAGGGDARSGPDGSEMLVYPAPGATGEGWVTVRVPADQLDAAMAQLREIGQVTSSTVSRQDVTDQAIDVRARIASGEASVARLTELMAQAADVADLIAAETALSERQATLESDRQQLAWLEGQVELSTLSVQLTPRSTAVEADPAGFTDGVVAGWNGLVASLNGLVIAIGFLLPWIAVAALAAAVVWGIVRLVRTARRRRTRTSGPSDPRS